MKKIITFISIFVLLSVVGPGGAQSSNLPGPGWVSGLQVQNIGTASATVRLIAYGQDGTSFLCEERSVAAGGQQPGLVIVIARCRLGSLVPLL